MDLENNFCRICHPQAEPLIRPCICGYCHEECLREYLNEKNFVRYDLIQPITCITCSTVFDLDIEDNIIQPNKISLFFVFISMYNMWFVLSSAVSWLVCVRFNEENRCFDYFENGYIDAFFSGFCILISIQCLVLIIFFFTSYKEALFLNLYNHKQYRNTRFLYLFQFLFSIFSIVYLFPIIIESPSLHLLFQSRQINRVRTYEANSVVEVVGYGQPLTIEQIRAMRL